MNLGLWREASGVLVTAFGVMGRRIFGREGAVVVVLGASRVLVEVDGLA